MIDLWLLPLMLLTVLALALGTGVAMAQPAYSSADNGKVITVNSGDTFTVQLEENPSTGYSWNLTIGDGLELVSDQYMANPVPADVVGSGGYHVWTIKAVTPGSHVISGVYKRPWESVSESVSGSGQTYMLTVNVQGTGVIPDISYPAIEPIDNTLFPSSYGSWFSLADIFKNLPDLSQFKFL